MLEDIEFENQINNMLCNADGTPKEDGHLKVTLFVAQQIWELRKECIACQRDHKQYSTDIKALQRESVSQKADISKLKGFQGKAGGIGSAIGAGVITAIFAIYEWLSHGHKPTP